MQKIMNSSTMKKIVVVLDRNNIHEIDIDGEIFDDPHAEAATRAMEKCKTNQFGTVRPVTKCWEKKDEKYPRKHHLFNSYWILINASLYKKAEQLREKFKMQENVDLANEPLRAHVKSE